VGSGKHYAQILLAADSGLSDEDIAAAAAVGGPTVYRTKRRFVKGNLEARPERGAAGTVAFELVDSVGAARVGRAQAAPADCSPISRSRALSAVQLEVRFGHSACIEQRVQEDRGDR
jgi:hypothetical protein